MKRKICPVYFLTHMNVSAWTQTLASSIGRDVRTHEDNGAAPTAVSTLSEIKVEYEPSHSGLVKKLIEHFWYHRNVCKDITWVRRHGGM